MDFLLDVERVLLGMVGGAAIFMVAGVRPHLPKEGGLEAAGAIWARFNFGAFVAVTAVIVLAAIRLGDGHDRAWVHVLGGAVLLAVLFVKSRFDARQNQRILDAGPEGPDWELVNKDMSRIIPLTAAVQILSLVLGVAPA
jgi:hypothetical protein